MTNPDLDPSGESQDDPAEDPANKQAPRDSDTVKYATYQKVLGEKKRRDAELQELRAKLADREAEEKADKEAELRDQEKHKELLALRETELATTQAENESLKQVQRDSKKLSAVLDALPGNVEKKYWGLIDLDAVQLDDSGDVDANSVAKIVENFQGEHNRLIDKPGNPGQPSAAPQPNGSGGLVFKEWLKLPKRERDARLHEVSDAPDEMKSGRAGAIRTQTRI